MDLCDRVGPRLAGSPGYARAVEWALAELAAAGLSEVRREDVVVQGWERGAASLELVEPAPPRRIPVAALGRSVGTPAEGITAPLLVLRDFDELEARAAEAAGKIVLFNFAMPAEGSRGAAYGAAVAYRWSGASRAAKHGARAVLIRSVTTHRARSPHTGTMGYDEAVAKIPAAAIPVEDAEMLARLAAKGIATSLRLVLGAKDTGAVTDANVIAELKGRERPEEIVLVGAHLDGWDLSCGAHDDGAGVTLAIEAARLLKELGLVPRRTVRVVLFANEERGLDGGRVYAANRPEELARHVAAFETDSGGFRPTGFSFEGKPEAADRLDVLMPLFRSLGDLVVKRGGSGADISPAVRTGVPGLGFSVDGQRYFDYHHSELDTPDKVNPDELKDAVAAYALMTWLLAEMPEPLPR